VRKSAQRNTHVSMSLKRTGPCIDSFRFKHAAQPC
jgi:hypothetical protein